MNRVYKMNENEKKFDFTAVKILLSVIAILLSLTFPKNASFNWQPDVKKISCTLPREGSGSDSC